MFKNLNGSDSLQIIAIIIAIGSIIIAVLTLCQNKKILEETTRPYIVIYSTITNYQSPMYKLIIKNFGQSGGTITSFNCNYNLTDFTVMHENRQPFEGLNDIFIAPGQSIIYPINHKKLVEKDVKTLNFKIDYKINKKRYNESIDINVNAFNNQPFSKASTKNDELKIISFTLQDLVDRLL